MKRIIVLLVVMTLINGLLIGNNDPIEVNTEEDKRIEVSMTMEVYGAVQLYSVLKEEIELINTEVIEEPGKENRNNWHLAYNRDYFIGYNDNKVEAITPINFKQLAKKYFADLPILAASIGRKGFRYKNLPTIILYYNKQIIQGKTIIKEDKLVVKQHRE